MRTKTERLRLIRDSFHSECEQIVGRMFRLGERGRQNPSKLWAVPLLFTDVITLPFVKNREF